MDLAFGCVLCLLVTPIILVMGLITKHLLLPMAMPGFLLGLQTHHMNKHLLSSQSLLKHSTIGYFEYSENAKRVHNHCYQTQY